QLIDARKLSGNVRDDEGVLPGIVNNLTSLGQTLRQGCGNNIGLGVVENVGVRNGFGRRFPGISQSFTGCIFGPERRIRRDAKNVTLKLSAELVLLQYHIQRLIPRNIRQVEHGKGTGDVRIENDIEAAGFADQTEEVL